MPTTLHENRPSAGIGVVEVQKPMVFFCDFCGARATLCGDRRGRGAKTHGFLRFLKFPRDPLQGSAWFFARCKNFFCERFFAISKVQKRGFFAISAVLAQPSAGSAFSRCKNSRFFATCLKQLAQSNLRSATCADQLAPTSLRRAPCLEQLAQSNLR